ncbi:diaminopimelate decarboxylase [Spirulina subsalsa FACHB-351]|uniref:Diaminopimelate decarboxylase n=1 Tax=Spirulina subsalsa FACHB-351 TaxID=234711 RepID=A0ABT3L6Y8_9CYAN|nr:diaminopimelate decarboxylase [Spirulina subsalsa]MCW6037276.1 diaminopimelate decarboxylase [Spirulina subsalsa FACHB-351]
MLLTDSSPKTSAGTQYLPQGDRTLLSPNQCLMPLTAKVNDQDTLEIGGCSIADLVAQYGSPLYILDEFTLRTACRQYQTALARYYPGEATAIYASKAWNCLAVCALVASEGLGIDVVSGGELYTALKAGFNPQNIYLHGNNKSRSELQFAYDKGCTIIVDNQLELELLSAIASPETPARILLRLTPGIECHTHEYIRTGHIDSKFGFDPNQLPAIFATVAQHPSLQCLGLHAHIGSQIFERQPHQDLGRVLVDWLKEAKTYNLSLEILNIGGGLGICYTESDDPPSIEEWVKAAAQSVASACRAYNLPLPKLICEPGRSLIGSACVTAYTVGSRKEIPDLNRTYVAVDGGMSDNPRPITYQSLYRAVVANHMTTPSQETVTLAGKHCESGDIVIQSAQLPPTQPGDLIVVLGTGAYNYSMASNYNRLARPAAVLVHEGDAQIILERETYEDLLRQDRLPEKLQLKP